MKIENGKATGIKIAYIGGGSRGWAWNLMSDLAQESALGGEVCLYDIDIEAARKNEIIGNSIAKVHKDMDNWTYSVSETLEGALSGANFVIISILPGTFEEMRSDVHTPEKYGIYQSVGDTMGPGGIIRALRTIPMYEVIANGIKENCPDAWVINYTNPMTMCTRSLYKVFPEIKAFGCCHEVFGTQKFLANILEKKLGIKDIKREEIRCEVMGVNHFTWLKSAHYNDIDIFPIYKEFCEENIEVGVLDEIDDNWLNRVFHSKQQVKMDLFLRYGYIAAAGDRHLAEACPSNWYLENPECVEKWGFGLTSIEHRYALLDDKLRKSAALVSGEEQFEINPSGEEGIRQIKAILGLDNFVTNVNMPNRGQISNLPMGAVVETNASFASGTVSPVTVGELPPAILGLTIDHVIIQEMVVEAAVTKNLDLAFQAFCKDGQVATLNLDDAKALFDEMIENTKEYLTMYNI